MLGNIQSPNIRFQISFYKNTIYTNLNKMYTVYRMMGVKLYNVFPTDF